MQIVEASTPSDLAVIRLLFEEYAAWLRVDLCFQKFSGELAGLPGAYARPLGRLFLAKEADEPAGCIALRPLDEQVCEMKRLYVRPAFRRRGLGRALAQRVIADAKSVPYTTMVLDTLAHMHDAIRLYEKLGFVRRTAYYDTPLPDTVFMELRL